MLIINKKKKDADTAFKIAQCIVHRASGFEFGFEFRFSTISREITQAGKRAFCWFGGV